MKTHSIGSKVLAAVGLTMLATVPASATDFSCREAGNAAEKTICNHASLGALDDRMARSYGLLWQRSSYRDRLQLRAEQRRFLSFRDTCGRDVRCIKGAYLDQISVLDGKLAEVFDD